MRILGMDVGDKTIGLAVSDSLGITAQGVGTIKRRSYEKDFGAIRDCMEQYGAVEAVVGLPKSLDGTLGPQADKVLAFVEKLKEATGLKVVLVDERLTTSMAERALVDADVSRKNRKKVIDMLAAQIILQGYLDRKRADKE